MNERDKMINYYQMYFQCDARDNARANAQMYMALARQKMKGSRKERKATRRAYVALAQDAAKRAARHDRKMKTQARLYALACSAISRQHYNNDKFGSTPIKFVWR